MSGERASHRLIHKVDGDGHTDCPRSRTLPGEAFDRAGAGPGRAPPRSTSNRSTGRFRMGLLEGKVAIVTGASKGIGRVMSLRFAREGARVVCAARSADLVKETAAQVSAAGGQAIAGVGDAAVEEGGGRRGLPYRIGYCSAKAGQVGMTYGMALELAPHGIRVNCVAPGAVDGDRIDRVIAGQASVKGISVEAQRKAMIERMPLKRFVTAEDIVDATLFLASDMARSVSGQVVAVNAGEPAG